MPKEVMAITHAHTIVFNATILRHILLLCLRLEQDVYNRKGDKNMIKACPLQQKKNYYFTPSWPLINCYAIVSHQYLSFNIKTRTEMNYLSC